ncbi:hypothetical protein [Paenirhodobacter populi]|nr:hypothetical protein [Sinirhodobacter populi]
MKDKEPIWKGYSLRDAVDDLPWWSVWGLAACVVAFLAFVVL